MVDLKGSGPDSSDPLTRNRQAGVQGDLFDGSLPVVASPGSGASLTRALEKVGERSEAAFATELTRLRGIVAQFHRTAENANPPKLSEDPSALKSIESIFQGVFNRRDGLQKSRVTLLACLPLSTEMCKLPAVFAAAANAIIKRLRDLSAAMATNTDYTDSLKGPEKCTEALRKLEEVRHVIHDFSLEENSKASDRFSHLFKTIVDMRRELLRDLVKGLFRSEFVAECRTYLGIERDSNDDWLFEGLRWHINGKRWEAARQIIAAIEHGVFSSISTSLLNSAGRKKQIIQILSVDLTAGDAEGVQRFLELPLRNIGLTEEVTHYLTHPSTLGPIQSCLAKAADRQAFARAINNHANKVIVDERTTLGEDLAASIMQALA